MQALTRLADRHGVALIEDAAQAVGSEFQGRHAGSFGAISVFSFHGSKTLTTGEGGMLLTDDAAIYERVRVLRDHGRQPGDIQFWNTEVAYKYKMTDMQAALGLAQLERVDELVRRKRAIFAWYQEQLECVPGLTLNPEVADVTNSYYMVTILLDPALRQTRDRLMAGLTAQGIGCRPFFHPLSSLPAYAHLPQIGEAEKHNPCAHALAPRGINLPSGFNMTPQCVHYVCDQVKALLAV